MKSSILCGLYWTFCSSSITFLAQGWHKTGFGVTAVASPAPNRMVIFLQPAGSAVANEVQYAVSFQCCIGALLNHVQLVFHQDPTPFSAKLLSRQWAPSLYCCMGLFHFSCKVSGFVFVELLEFLSAHSYSLLKCIWVAAPPSSILMTAPSLSSYVYLLRTFSVPLSDSLVKLLTVLVSLLYYTTSKWPTLRHWTADC